MTGRRPLGVFVLCLVVGLAVAGLPARSTYNYRIVDPLRGLSLADINLDFWEPWNAPGGSEAGYFSISDDGLILGSFSVYLGVLPGARVGKWALAGDFRISFFLETSPNPGGYGNRLHANVYETAPLGGETCGTLVYTPLFDREGFAGLWMGYSSPPAHTYFPLQYDDAAFFLFVRQGSEFTIYKGDSDGVSESDNLVFHGSYLNPDGRFLFMLGTGNPNSGWMRVRDVVIDTEDLVACDAAVPIPDDWASGGGQVDSDGDGVTDDVDQCPGTAPGTPVDATGCPLDSDGDGVTDDVDQCPGTAPGTPVDATGCPLDSDGDGVTDDVDQCPGTPPGTPVDATGCPLDSDGDGVTENLDQCPGTAAGAVVDGSGCSIAQIAPCAGPWKNHGEYVSAVARAAQRFLELGLITAPQQGAIVSAAARSQCGRDREAGPERLNPGRR